MKLCIWAPIQHMPHFTLEAAPFASEGWLPSSKACPWGPWEPEPKSTTSMGVPGFSWDHAPTKQPLRNASSSHELPFLREITILC